MKNIKVKYVCVVDMLCYVICNNKKLGTKHIDEMKKKNEFSRTIELLFLKTCCTMHIRGTLYVYTVY
jgi:hypothetical protein